MRCVKTVTQLFEGKNSQLYQFRLLSVFVSFCVKSHIYFSSKINLAIMGVWWLKNGLAVIFWLSNSMALYCFSSVVQSMSGRRSMYALCGGFRGLSVSWCADRMICGFCYLFSFRVFMNKFERLDSADSIIWLSWSLEKWLIRGECP